MKKLFLIDLNEYEWTCKKHGKYISSVPKCLECYPIKQIKEKQK